MASVFVEKYGFFTWIKTFPIVEGKLCLKHRILHGLDSGIIG